MAASYTLTAQNIAFAANKCMACIFNGVGSGKVVRVYRIWVYNNQLVTVTGVLTNLEIRKITAASGGTDLTFTKHDSNSAAVDANIVAGTNKTVTLGGLYRRVLWSTDEPTANTAISLDEFECFMPFTNIWSMGYADTNSEPITLREGEGVTVMNTGGSIGQCDLFFETTIV